MTAEVACAGDTMDTGACHQAFSGSTLAMRGDAADRQLLEPHTWTPIVWWMRPRAATLGSNAAHYVLAYAVALPIFVLFMITRRLLRRQRRGRGSQREAR